jgi:hypothetical protein
MAREAQQALRGAKQRTKPCPSQLERLITLVNTVLNGHERKLLGNFSQQLNLVLALVFTRGGEKMAEEAKAELEARWYELPSQIRDFIGPIYEADVYDLQQKLDLITKGRDLLLNIASKNEQSDDLASSEIVIFGAEVFTRLRVNSKGQLFEAPSLLLKALTDGGVEAKRIRLCQICRCLFWAGRTDKPCCGPKCSGILRQRKYRRNYLEKYKPQRIRKAEEQES